MGGIKGKLMDVDAQWVKIETPKKGTQFINRNMIRSVNFEKISSSISEAIFAGENGFFLKRRRTEMKKIQEHLGLVFLIIIAILQLQSVDILRCEKAFLLGMIFITKSVQISLCTTQSTMLNEQKMILFLLVADGKKTECFLYHERGSGHVFICG